MINDTMIDDFEKGIKELKDNDAIEQSLALVEIVKDLLDTTKKHLNRVYLLLGISLMVNFLTVGSFLLYESQFEYANELMYMGKMADFNEVMEMIEDVDKELEHLEKLMLKLKSVDYNIEYVMDMQEQLCDEYNEKIEQLFVEKLEEDKIKRKHKTKYSMEEQYQRRSARTGRYIRG